MIKSPIQTQPGIYSWIDSWGLPLGLIVLGLTPVGMGVIRIGDVSSGATLYAPYFPVVVHIASVTVYCFAGALQFSKKVRQTKPRWHRLIGRWVLPTGFVSVLTGLWLTQFYPNPPFDGTWVYVARISGGLLMLGFLFFGAKALQNRKFHLHGRAMMRAYAIGIGAGTQVVFLGMSTQLLGIDTDAVLALCITAGWALNLFVVELCARPEA